MNTGTDSASDTPVPASMYAARMRQKKEERRLQEMQQKKETLILPFNRNGYGCTMPR